MLIKIIKAIMVMKDPVTMITKIAGMKPLGLL